MTEVDQDYQYSVEVKSRFSLFLDSALNNEDPDILISKLQTERTKRNRKEKVTTNVVQQVIIPNEVVPDVEAEDEQATKGRALKSSKPAQAPTTDDHATSTKEQSVQIPSAARGRGDGSFGRVFRGRGRGFRPPFHESAADATGDPRIQSNSPYESRGRGGGRGRFIRDRTSGYMDHRGYGTHAGGEQGIIKAADAESPETRPVESTNGNHDVIESVADQEVSANDEYVDPESANVPNEFQEEPKTYTLDEYKAMRSSTKPVVTITSKDVRKANDGKDVFANMIPHRKISEVSDEEDEEVIETGKAPEPEPAYEINVSFTDRFNDRGRGFRGGVSRGRGAAAVGFRGGGRSRGPLNSRGGYRGDRGRGFARGPVMEQQAPPVIHSDQDFPTLK